MTAYPHDRYGLIRRDAALRRGISDSCRANDVKAGRLISLIPGVNVEPSADFDGQERAQKLYRLKAIAVATSEIARPLPLSHASAAAMLGLPLLKPDLARVHVTTGLPGGGSVGTVRHLHPAPLDPAELRTIDGLVVTSLERTAIDVATMGDFAQAFTAFDQALRLGADRDQMSEMLAARRRRGGKVARVALTSATGQAENVGESWSCAQIVDARYPTPRQQHRIRVASGSTYVTDFDGEWLVVGEFDGMIKYGRLRRPGESIADAVIREKLREDEIRDTGPRVVRWTWNDLERDAFIPRLHRRLAPLGLVAA